MKRVIQHNVYGSIIYEEGAWTGKKSLTINGVPLTKVDKTHYTYSLDGELITVELKGNTLTGVTLKIQNEVIRLVDKPAWYVLVLSILMFIFVIVWGNSPTLCAVFPIVGGFIGGAICGIGAVLNVLIAGMVKKASYKILIGVGFFIATILLCYIIAVVIIAAATVVA
ncbi:MAG: hypothetical protein IJ329_00405 [Clostridia bacterium]|nr:hypothetical protein [Clostridia bacterium]